MLEAALCCALSNFFFFINFVYHDGQLVFLNLFFMCGLNKFLHSIPEMQKLLCASSHDIVIIGPFSAVGNIWMCYVKGSEQKFLN